MTTAARIQTYQDISRSTRLAVFDCASCGLVYGIPNDYDKRRREDGHDFYCPNGHINVYRVDPIDKVKQELERTKDALESEREYIGSLRKSNSALKGVVTRTKNRVAAGVCPECRERIPNLARHMHDNHPDYAKGESTTE